MAAEVIVTATITITIAAIAVRLGNPVQAWLWLVIPVVFCAGALVPTVCAHRAWSHLGLRRVRPRKDLIPTAAGVVAIAVALGVVGWAFHAAGVALPLPPRPDGPWSRWIVYQFLYIAPAEELFFRGYAQERFHMLLGGCFASGKWRHAGAVTMSATLFAVAHAVVLGSPVQAWVFFPALLFGAMRAWTGSIFASVVLHAWANVAYAALVAVSLGQP